MQWRRAIATIILGASLGPTYARSAADPQDIVVEGTREQRVLQGGEWIVSVSRSYRIGKSLDGETSVAVGKDREWHFCLADTEVEDFARLLVGEGRSQAAGTTECRPLKMRLGEGRLSATQTCQGGYASSKDESTGRVTSFQTRLMMYVSGRYGGSSLKLDFENRREPLVNFPAVSEIGAKTPPDIMRWSVNGERKGDCTIEPNRR